MTGLAQGDVSVQISANGRKDEIAAMASAVEVFRGNAIERKRLEAKQEADLVEKEQRVKAMDKLIRGFDEQITAVLNTVSSAATQLDGMAKEMNDVASKTNQLSTDAPGQSMSPAPTWRPWRQPPKSCRSRSRRSARRSTALKASPVKRSPRRSAPTRRCRAW